MAMFRSSDPLRLIATALTLVSFAGTSVFAATHLYNPAAPLQPSTAAVATILAGGDGDDDDERAAPTAAPATRTRTTITPSVGITTSGALTRTGQS